MGHVAIVAEEEIARLVQEVANATDRTKRSVETMHFRRSISLSTSYVTSGTTLAFAAAPNSYAPAMPCPELTQVILLPASREPNDSSGRKDLFSRHDQGSGRGKRGV
eukprot:3932738-Rhodomonas_salina.2